MGLRSLMGLGAVCAGACAVGGLVAASAFAELGGADLLERQLESQRQRKGAVQAELGALSGRRAEIQSRLRERARALYRLERGGLLPLSGGLEALLRHASNLRRLEGLVLDDMQALRELEQRGRELRAATSRLTGKIALVESSLSEARRAEAIRQARQARDTRFEQTFQESRGPTGRTTLRTASGTLSLVDDEPLPSRFADQRGNLALPVSGPSEIRDATRAESDGQGLELVSRSGATVRASEAGRVAFSDEYASYGRIVILDHGERHYTVYAGLGRIDVRVGDDVSRSARLGSVGESGVLYFEVRKGTRNEAPRPWLGL